MQMLSPLAVLVAGLLLYGRMPGLFVAAIACAAGALFWLAGHGHTHGEDAMTRIDRCAQMSGLNGVHTGLKMLCFGGALCAAVAARHVWLAVLVGMTMCAAILLFGKTPVHIFVSLMAAPAAFVLTGALALLLDVSAAPAGILSTPFLGRFLVLTAENQSAALFVTVKALAAVSCLYGLSLSTPLYEMLAVWRTMKVPELAIELMFLIYRYVFVLLQTLTALQTAAAARLGFDGAKAAFRTAGGIMTGLLTLSLGRASAAFDAMEARGYDGTLRFASTAKPLTLRHGALAALFGCALAAALVAERMW